MNKQTAVQQLRKMLEQQIPEQMEIVCFWLMMAEKREKQQIVDAHRHGLIHVFDNPNVASEEYYTDTYGGKN